MVSPWLPYLGPHSQGNHLKRKLVLKWPGESVKLGKERERAKGKGLQLITLTSAAPREPLKTRGSYYTVEWAVLFSLPQRSGNQTQTR